MKIKGVLWDMDGVLVDTGELHFWSWKSTLAKYGIPFSRQVFQQTFGMNNRGILTLLLGQAPEEELFIRISHQKETAFREAVKGRVTPLPGVLDTLNYLGSRGIRQAIASSAPQENIDALVDELRLRLHFSAIISGAGMPGKPAPDTFLASARAIGVPPEACLVVEDSVKGVEGARNAKMRCLAVTNTNPAALLRQADAVVDSLAHLGPAFWDKILGAGFVN
jgi:HAD superfamily hydrolase (TIGR01509 family)